MLLHIFVINLKSKKKKLTQITYICKLLNPRNIISTVVESEEKKTITLKVERKNPATSTRIY